jgi:hypothetical protein
MGQSPILEGSPAVSSDGERDSQEESKSPDRVAPSLAQRWDPASIHESLQDLGTRTAALRQRVYGMAAGHG